MSKAKKGSHFLEIGAGNLKLSQALLNKCSRGVAIDYSDSVLSFYEGLSASIKSKLTVFNADLNSFQTESKFDLVICCEVLEHIENDALFLNKTKDFLKHNGQIILSVPAKMKYWSVHDEIVGHLRRYEKNELFELFKEAGYADIHIISYGYPFLPILWRLRRSLAKIQKPSRDNLSTEEKTKVSGYKHANKIWNFLGYIINSTTLKPLFYFSKLFNEFDLSEGYLVFATKEKPSNKTKY